MRNLDTGDAYRNAQEMMVDSIDEVEWISEKDLLKEERTPMLRIAGGNRSRGKMACEIQELTGGYFMWEDDVHSSDATVTRRMKDIGGGQVKIGEKRIWSNSELILNRVKEEKERRQWRRSRGMSPVDTQSWGSIIQKATIDQVKLREVDDVDKAEHAPLCQG